jgi:hypothetical protein
MSNQSPLPFKLTKNDYIAYAEFLYSRYYDRDERFQVDPIREKSKGEKDECRSDSVM